MFVQNLDEYQDKARITAIYPQDVAGELDTLGLIYTVTKLNGESGELAEHVGKMIRDDGCMLTPERREAMILELGDVLWYVAMIAEELNTYLSVIARRNLEKLADRKARGKIKGEGSDR